MFCKALNLAQREFDQTQDSKHKCNLLQKYNLAVTQTHVSTIQNSFID